MSDHLIIPFSTLDGLTPLHPSAWRAAVLEHATLDGQNILIPSAAYSAAMRAFPRLNLNPAPRPGLGDLVASVATPIARALKLSCIDPATRQLREDSACARRKRWLNARFSGTPPASRIFLNGGLGDIFLGYYGTPAYDQIESRTRPIELFVWCKNPFARELWTWRAPDDLLKIHACDSESIAAGEKQFGVKWKPHIRGMPRQPDTEIRFDISPGDAAFLNHVRAAAAGRPIVVLSASAGDIHRNLPLGLVKRITAHLLDAGCCVCAVGRNYTLGNRREQPAPAGAIDCIDRLSVPGACELMRLAGGAVLGHSSLNIIGWFLRKPQLLLYPDDVGARHFGKQRTRWSFGRDYPGTTSATFDACAPGHVARFVKLSHKSGVT